MNGELLELSREMSDMELRLAEKISGLGTAISGMNGTFTSEISSAKERIKDLEDENVREAWRTWAGRISFGGVILAIHKGLTLLGWKI